MKYSDKWRLSLFQSWIWSFVNKFLAVFATLRLLSFQLYVKLSLNDSGASGVRRLCLIAITSHGHIVRFVHKFCFFFFVQGYLTRWHAGQFYSKNSYFVPNKLATARFFYLKYNPAGRNSFLKKQAFQVKSNENDQKMCIWHSPINYLSNDIYIRF